MALDTIQRGSVTGNGAEVDASGRALVRLPDAATPANVGAVRAFAENDDGTLSGTAYLKSGEVSPDFRNRVGVDSVLFHDVFNATSQNTGTWRYVFNTLTASQPGAGTLNFGTVQGTTSAHGAFMHTKQYFPLVNTAPLAVEALFGQFTAAMISGEVFLCGLGLPSAATTIPTDGVWIKVTSAGVFGVISFNGTPIENALDAALPLSALTVGTIFKFLVVVGEREVEFWFNDQFLGHMDIPAANGIPFLQGSAPLFMMKYNTGAVSNTNTMRVSRVGVTLMDVATGRPWGQQQAIMGMAAYQGQNGHTQGTTALLPNATAATTVTGAALAQATALATGLGGQAGITAAVPGVDGWVTAYTNPASTINITGRNLVITGVHISSVNIGAAVATTPTTMQWSIAFGGTQLNSLATAEGASFSTATVKAARRVGVGLQSWIIGAAIGQQAQELDQDFSNAPIVVAPGELVGAVAKFIQGTATASQVIWALVTFRGYYE
jgi:hypothetical protein